MSYSIQFLEMQPGAKAKTFKPVQMQKPVIVFGSSGHARSIAVILEQLNIEIIGFIDSYLPKGTRVLKYKTLGDETVLTRALYKFGTLELVVGIGDCSYNARFFLRPTGIFVKLNRAAIAIDSWYRLFDSSLFLVPY